MGAIRVEIISLAVQSTTGAAFDVWLDCWRATIRIAPARGEWFVDGVPAAEAFLLESSGTGDGNSPIALGGLTVLGKPVNLNHTLRFTPDGVAGPCNGVVVKEYWDPEMPDPITSR